MLNFAKFIPGRFLSLLNIFRRDTITLLIAMKNPATPWRVKGILLAAVIYLISPVDLLPDILPFMGIVDDVVIVPTAIYGVMQLLPKNVRDDSEQKSAVVSRRMPYILAGATIFVLLWFGLFIFMLYSLVKHLFF